MSKICKRFSLIERNQIVEKAQQCLWVDEGTPGRKYLFEKRHLSEEVVRKFGLGYIPVFVNHQLRGRIIFPLHDASGNLIAVSSRALNPEKSFLPVYWHESYEKQFYLYGADVARSSVRQAKFVIVVEGQFDVLQLWNHGIKNVVGLFGNKLSDVQISLIRRYCDEIVLLLDTDENQAGQRGTEKVLQKTTYIYDRIPENFSAPLSGTEQDYSTGSRKILSVAFPENSDPDEFVRTRGVQQLRKLIKERRDEFYRE